MSTENVKLVGQLQPPPDRDLVVLFNDPKTVDVLVDAMAPQFDAAIVSSFTDVDGNRSQQSGLPGLRKTWLEWLAAWQTFRADTQKLLPIGDTVLIIVDDWGILKGTEEEIRRQGAAIWTVANGQVTEIDYFADRKHALEAVGLA